MEAGGPNRRWHDPGNSKGRRRPLPEGITAITLRIPTTIYERTRLVAHSHRRSINDEVLIALEDHLQTAVIRHRLDDEDDGDAPQRQTG